MKRRSKKTAISFGIKVKIDKKGFAETIQAATARMLVNGEIERLKNASKEKIAELKSEISSLKNNYIKLRRIFVIMKTLKPKNKTEKMIYEIFRLCDKTVWLEDWHEFQETFEKILKTFGYDLYPIYFGKTKEDWMKQKKEVYDKWVADSEKAKKRAKKPIVYIKNRPQKLKV